MNAHLASTAEKEFLSLWDNLWRVNQSVAEAYGLTSDDLEYVLSTFPVFARKRPNFFAYLQQRVAEWKSKEGIIAQRSRCYITPPEHTSISRVAEEARKYIKKGRN